MNVHMHQYGLFQRPARWFAVSKGDLAARELADRHYSRQTPGHPQWTRPGFNYVLRAFDDHGEATFVWWRPKWEAGVERMDKLRVLECTIFRNETRVLSSHLILEAVRALRWSDARVELHHDYPERFLLITGVNARATEGRRGKHHAPGYCFRMAGWTDFDKPATDRADVWLQARCLSAAGVPL